MTKPRTFSKVVISDAAAAAAIHNVRVILHPTGEIEFDPSKAAKRKDRDDSPEAELERWVEGRKARSEDERRKR